MTQHARYNSWPLGQLPESWRRFEPEQIKSLGYVWEDARQICTLFEDQLSLYTGAPHVVLTDCCTHALELSLRYQIEQGSLGLGDTVTIPARTYVSVPLTIANLGLRLDFDDGVEWSGEYQLGFTKIFDSAARFTSGMFNREAKAQCLSFQIKKRLPIGRGGAILTSDPSFAAWARLASYDGRDLTTPYNSAEHVRVRGFHYYMTPEDAARGLLLLNEIDRHNKDTMDWMHYPDLRTWQTISSLVSNGVQG